MLSVYGDQQCDIGGDRASAVAVLRSLQGKYRIDHFLISVHERSGKIYVRADDRIEAGALWLPPWTCNCDLQVYGPQDPHPANAVPILVRLRADNLLPDTPEEGAQPGRQQKNGKPMTKTLRWVTCL